jgi:hypothetical protein
MPNGNGVEAAFELKQKLPNTPVVIFTLYKTNERLAANNPLAVQRGTDCGECSAWLPGRRQSEFVVAYFFFLEAERGVASKTRTIMQTRPGMEIQVFPDSHLSDRT